MDHTRGRDTHARLSAIADTVAALAAADHPDGVDRAAVEGSRRAIGGNTAIAFDLARDGGGRLAVRHRDGAGIAALPGALVQAIRAAAGGPFAAPDGEEVWLVDDGLAVRRGRADGDDAADELALRVIATCRAIIERHASERATLAASAERSATIARLAAEITEREEIHAALQLVIDHARAATRASYGALGVFEDARATPAFFVWSGLSAEQGTAIGSHPMSHGLLGVVLSEGRPMVVPRIAADDRRTAFPPNHPPMSTLLAVPVMVASRPSGNLYLADKAGGAFGDEDVATAEICAAHAAMVVARHRARSAAVSATRWLLSQQADRRRFANELHDDCAQLLAALALDADSLARQTRSTEDRDAARQLRDAITGVARQIHDIARDLRSAHPDGLALSLGRRAERLERETGIRVDFTVGGLESAVAAELEDTLARVQSAAVGGAQERGATFASVLVSGGVDVVRMIVEDDGRDTDAGSEAVETVRSIVALAGGRLRIEAASGQGTMLVVELTQAKEGEE